jgi:hypothetical protein
VSSGVRGQRGRLGHLGGIYFFRAGQSLRAASDCGVKQTSLVCDLPERLEVGDHLDAILDIAEPGIKRTHAPPG